MSMDLRVSDLQVFGPDDEALLSIPDLSIASGSAIGITGPSGAGKSTLLFALAGLWDGARGAVHWDGQDIFAATPAARTAFRAKSIGIIFQDYLLFETLSAFDNARLAALFRPKMTRAPIEAAAAATLAALDVPKTRTSATLSGGERQRVAVARALAHDPPILLADEPTASLPRQTADALSADLLRLVRERGKTLIAVSHDARLLDQMDRVLTLHDGRLLA